MPTEKNPKVGTVYGRLSYPVWTAQEEYDRSQKGDYPAKSVAEAKPSFNLLVEQPQLDKFLTQVRDHFMPYVLEQNKKGEKRDNLDPKEVTALLNGLEGDLAEQTFNSPVKNVPEKTAALVPEAVASIKIIGNAGVDFELKAVVNDEQELIVPGDILSFPVIVPINQSVHKMYAGALVAVTYNLYAYHNGKHPGFSAGAGVAIFKADADRIGGGAAVDEDEIFAD